MNNMLSLIYICTNKYIYLNKIFQPKNENKQFKMVNKITIYLFIRIFNMEDKADKNKKNANV